MRGNKESPTEPYYLVRRVGDDEVDEAERVFQRFLSRKFIKSSHSPGKVSGMNHIGLLGESIASRYLESRGYLIIARQFRVRGGEIDIIATINGALVFVEVKTRTDTSFGSGIESLTLKKNKTLKRAMSEFLRQNPILAQNKSIQWDVINLLVEPKNRKILVFTHYKNVHLR